MKINNIAYVSGTRADFGLMTPVLKEIDKSDKLKLRLFATGMHLMPEFGYTIDQVKKEFPNTKVIKTVFTSNDRLGMARFSGDYLHQLVKSIGSEKLDFMLILGDRIEMLCTALASTYLGIPTIHLHGGEKTFTIDEVARHAITKLSNLHFATTVDSAERIRRLGEDAWRIHVVGAPALDVILNEVLPTKEELFQKLKVPLEDEYILVLQHSVTEQIDDAAKQMKQTVDAVKALNLPVVVIYPNSDPGGRAIIEMIKQERNNPKFHIFKSLEHKYFLALERDASVWVGNSSAGIIESASFHTPVVNVGDRQNGRPQSGNVINVTYKKKEIVKAIEKSLHDLEYLRRLKRVKNIWGDGHASERIVRVISEIDLDDRLLRKQITY